MSYSKGEYLPTMISGKNAAREPTAGVNEAKICPKIAIIPIENVIIQVLCNISTYFCVSQRKHI